jgi:hypothetical protein
MGKINFKNRILISITGDKEAQWKNKLEEIKKFKIAKVALFLSRFNASQRKKIYKALLDSDIKEIPLVHVRNDMKLDELKFLAEKYKTSCFTIHENGFKFFKKWKGFHKSLFLEMNTDDFIHESVEVEKIGGFCIDLAHFMVSLHKQSKELRYIYKRKDMQKYFACNHLSGYSPTINSDMHIVKNLEDFDYIAALPEFLFGRYIAIEVDNNISEQLKFKEYVSTKRK